MGSTGTKKKSRTGIPVFEIPAYRYEKYRPRPSTLRYGSGLLRDPRGPEHAAVPDAVPDAVPNAVPGAGERTSMAGGRPRAALRRRMNYNYSFLKMNNFCNNYFGNFWKCCARFGKPCGKEQMGRHRRNRNAYTGNIRDSNPRTGQDSQHHYLQFGRIPTILKTSFVITANFVFFLLYL